MNGNNETKAASAKLPAGWLLAAMEDVADVNPRSFCPLPQAKSLPVHFVPMNAVAEEFGGIDISAKRPLGEVQKGYTPFLENDVLFAKITPCMENGKGALVPALPNDIAYGSTEFHVLRSIGVVTAKWLALYLSQAEFRRMARQHMSGSAGQLRVQTVWLSTFQIPVAPLAEQTRIVAKLEELLSDLDAAVAELKAAQKKLAQYRQALLKAAVEGTLTAAWRAAQIEPQETGAQLLARILTERRHRWQQKQLAKFKAQGKTPLKDWQDKYPEPQPPDTTGLPELPEGWVWSSIGQCFEVSVGATPSRKRLDYWSGGIPWVSSGEVRFTHIKETRESISEAGLANSSTEINPKGSVLLGMIGEGKTRGQVAILDIEAANNQNCAAIWVSETDIPSEYVYQWLWSRYDETRRGSSGNNQPALNKTLVEKIPMPLPPLSEIRQIAQLVEEGLTLGQNQETATEFSLKQAKAQRKNILKAAFSGQLVAQDPHDEPARVLLERIRAARATQAKPRKGGGKKKE